MASAAVWLLGVSLALGWIAAIAVALPSLLRLLVWAQVGYWTFSYVLRPLVLLTVLPTPGRGDAIADPRLASDSYTTVLANVLGIILAGLVCYGFALWAYSVWIRGRRPRGLIDNPNENYGWVLRTLTALTVIGWAGRILGATGMPLGSFLSVLHLVASAGVVGLILIVTGLRHAATYGVLFCLVLGELAWSVVIESKTPAFAAAFALLIRLICRQGTRPRAARAVLLMAACVPLYWLVQAVKLTPDAQDDLVAADAAYPSLLQLALPFIRRFDMLSAVTDAYFVGPGGWVPGTEMIRLAIEIIVPAPLQTGEKVALGSEWASAVRAASLIGANTDVSLAAGSIAEGWASAGWVGIAVQALALVLVLHLVYILLTSQTPGRIAFAALLLANPVLFERGIFGGLVIFSKSLQAVLIAFLIGLLLRRVRTGPWRPVWAERRGWRSLGRRSSHGRPG